jgi:hypothetical protein
MVAFLLLQSTAYAGKGEGSGSLEHHAGSMIEKSSSHT